jgi:hypothetical protein
MDPKIAGGAVGLIIGAAGYVIVKFWILPIRDYRKLKTSLAKDITHYENAAAQNKWNSGNKKRFKATRKAVSDLIDTYVDDLPVWYKILLRRRGESPQEAQKQLMGLSDIKDASHAEKRLGKARTALSMD